MWTSSAVTSGTPMLGWCDLGGPGGLMPRRSVVLCPCMGWRAQRTPLGDQTRPHSLCRWEEARPRPR